MMMLKCRLRQAFGFKITCEGLRLRRSSHVKTMGLKMSWMVGLLLICFSSYCFSAHPLFVRRINFYYFYVLVFPLIFILGLYWGPALVYDAGEYKDWACVFIVPWLMVVMWVH